MEKIILKYNKKEIKNLEEAFKVMKNAGSNFRSLESMIKLIINKELLSMGILNVIESRKILEKLKKDLGIKGEKQ